MLVMLVALPALIPLTASLVQVGTTGVCKMVDYARAVLQAALSVTLLVLVMAVSVPFISSKTTV